MFSGHPAPSCHYVSKRWFRGGKQPPESRLTRLSQQQSHKSKEARYDRPLSLGNTHPVESSFTPSSGASPPSAQGGGRRRDRGRKLSALCLSEKWQSLKCCAMFVIHGPGCVTPLVSPVNPPPPHAHSPVPTTPLVQDTECTG